MRAVLVLVLLGCIAGCRVVGEPLPPDDEDDGGPFDHPFGCRTDDACGAGEVCARAGGCLPADQVRAVHVYWTLSGRAANRTTCASTPELSIRFSSLDDAGGDLAYSPVPCSQGKYTIDKLPTHYSEAALRVVRVDSWRIGMLDPVTGEVTIDLPF